MKRHSEEEDAIKEDKRVCNENITRGGVPMHTKKKGLRGVQALLQESRDILEFVVWCFYS